MNYEVKDKNILVLGSGGASFGIISELINRKASKIIVSNRTKIRCHQLIENFKNKDGIFPTGYQYSEKIFWPDERSTWTNAAYIIAKDCLYDVTKKKKALLV